MVPGGPAQSHWLHVNFKEVWVMSPYVKKQKMGVGWEGGREEEDYEEEGKSRSPSPFLSHSSEQASRGILSPVSRF